MSDSGTSGPSATKLDWLNKVLGIDLSATGKGDTGSAAALQAREKALIASLKAAAVTAAADPTRRAALRDATLKASEASAAIHKQDLAGASALLDAAEAMLDKLLDGGTAGGGGDPATRWRAAREAWQTASDTVDSQISALQSSLRASGNEQLEEIAEYGLNGVTGNFKVPLMAAMMEIGSGSPEALKKAGPKALQIISGFRNHLDGDEGVLVCDDNPFGVAVSIRVTLGAALTQMEAALTSAA